MNPSIISDYDAAVGFLDARIGQGVKPGLERIDGALELMTDPQDSFPIIHVAGTNGKTTVVRMVRDLIQAHGLRVGTFVSPHLHAVEGRYSIDGRTFGPDEFVDAVADVAPFIEIYEARADTTITYFELTAAIAFQAFAAAGVDVGVVEVGLGGRWDATNVVSADVSVITGIAMDHMSYLGDSIAQIAGEKAAILKQDGTLVSGPLPAAAEGAITAQVAATDSKWLRFDDAFSVGDDMMAVGGWSFTVHGLYRNYDEIFLSLHGRHQVDHFATAVAVSEQFFGRELDPEAVRVTAATMTSPGRIEVLQRNPVVVVDGSHNEQGIAGLAATLLDEFPPQEWLLVVGMKGERNVPDLLSPLEGVVAEVIATAAADPSSIPADEVAAAARIVFGDDVPVEAVTPVAQAVTEALDRTDDTGAIVIAGSLYVVGEARTRFV
jgi:dihydrofolate synthase/folylpolyglutamate synthase